MLAEMAGLGISTVADFELERRAVSPESSDRLQTALEAAGVEFTNGKRPGVRFGALKVGTGIGTGQSGTRGHKALYWPWLLPRI